MTKDEMLKKLIPRSFDQIRPLPIDFLDAAVSFEDL